MKQKFLVLMSAVVFLVVLAAGQAMAVDIGVAKIARVGVNPAATAPGYMVQLIDQSSTPAWADSRVFFLAPEVGDAGLATLLTAYSLTKTVWVRLIDTTAGSLVTVIYMND